MPLFFQHHIDDATRVAIWKIEEDESFFTEYVPLQRTITHPFKRLQHLAGRYLLQHLFSDFPISLIQIADTKKPFLEDEQYHFSISHCHEYAGVIVSKNKRVGIDIEIISDKVARIRKKFLIQEEQDLLITQMKNAGPSSELAWLTLAWSCKEAAFKWYGKGEVDFKNHMVIEKIVGDKNAILIQMAFKKNEDRLLDLHSSFFNDLVLTYVFT
ncbi:MAG TPA: 4'-phosphopantetheinyl transferase superfamily protein [Flavisolibacter sp.]|nr:4'-phosphopantetheinyl transferase superfamily protein [Flavisolibacter sp.]